MKYKITLDNVTKSYFRANESPSAPIVKELSLKIAPNELVCIVGHSGCGKTTLVNMMAGFIKPTEGEILIDGKSILSPGQCGVVFQSDSVFPWLTVRKNIEYGIKSKGIFFSKKKYKEISDYYIKSLNLEGLGDKWPRELSGGQLKRVDVARVYASNVDIILMDEAFASLDPFTKEEMQLRLLDIWHKQQKTIVFITHDIEEAIFLGQRVIVLGDKPSRIKQIINIPFGDIRKSALKLEPEFIQLRRQILNAMNQ